MAPQLVLISSLLCALATGSAPTYVNPVNPVDAPDPGVLYHQGKYYMVTTGGLPAFPIRVSTDLANWTQIGYVFTQSNHPSWVVNSYWAPEIHSIGGKFNVYFAGRLSSGAMAVGGGTADKPEGPYTPFNSPVVTHQYGAIDPTVGYENGTGGDAYLIWKVDGNSQGKPTPIFAQKLSPDGSKTVTDPVELIRESSPWEGSLVEGPWVVRWPGDGLFYLFYSGSFYSASSYAIGVARSSKLLGPYEKAQAPVMSQFGDNAPGQPFSGPGHCSVVNVPETGAWFMVYHSWLRGHCGKSPGRFDLVDRVTWNATSGGWPVVGNSGNPTGTALPVPTTADAAKMPPQTRLDPLDVRSFALETSQWAGNCWSSGGVIGGSCTDPGNHWVAIPGHYGPELVSMRSAKDPTLFWRHREGTLHLDHDDGSALFKMDSSFMPMSGLKDPSLVSLRSVNYPHNYVRHKDGVLRIDEWDGSDLMSQDGSFHVLYQ